MLYLLLRIALNFCLSSFQILLRLKVARVVKLNLNFTCDVLNYALPY